MRQTEDKALLEAARRGESEALASLWQRHAPWLRAVLLAHGTMGADGDDLLQEVAVTFVERHGEIRAGGALPGWLRQVAINVARSAGRKRSVRRILRPLGDAEASIPDPDQERQRERTRSSDQLEDVLMEVHKLPLELKEPLLMKSVEGLSQRDIARILSISESAVESRLARARRALRERIPMLGAREHKQTSPTDSLERKY